MSAIIFKKTERGRLGHLQLNLPEKRNILSLDLIQAFTEKLNALALDQDLKVLLLSGKGRHFCAGGDLRQMAVSQDISDVENIHQVRLLSKMFYSLSAFPLPVVGKIQGSAFGGGMGLVSLCDLTSAHKDTRFGWTELKFALIPALVTPFALKKVSPSKLRELILTAKVFSAEEAKNLDLVHFVGEAKDCSTWIQDSIHRLLSYDRVALKQTKKLLNSLPGMTEEEARDYTVQALAERRKSTEALQKINRWLKHKNLKSKKNDK